VEATGQRLGPANPLIYRAANSPDYSKLFSDITSGDNGAGKGPGFSAGTGYDHPTGWGVPNAAPLVHWLVQQNQPPAVQPDSMPAVPGKDKEHGPALPPPVIAPGLPDGKQSPR
jgi:hypothetical protein